VPWDGVPNAIQEISFGAPLSVSGKYVHQDGDECNESHQTKHSYKSYTVDSVVGALVAGVSKGRSIPVTAHRAIWKEDREQMANCSRFFGGDVVSQASVRRFGNTSPDLY